MRREKRHSIATCLHAAVLAHTVRCFTLLQPQKKYSALYSWLEPPWELWLECFTTSRLPGVQQAGGSAQQQLMKRLPVSPLNWSPASNQDVNFVQALKESAVFVAVMYVYCYTILYAICWLYLGPGHSLYFANLYYASVWLLKLPACFTHSIRCTQA